MSKVAIVTGSNKGIGLAIVKGLLNQFNGDVFLTSRDVNRGKAAIVQLQEQGLKPKFHQLDIDDQGSINKFRDFIKANYGGIDILVNNAGMAYKNDATESFSEQATNTLKTNYFSLLNVCETLFPLLKPHARVVNVSSVAGHLSQIKNEKLSKQFADPELTIEKLNELMRKFIKDANASTHKEEGWPNSSYVVSKVGVSALSRIQQKAFDNDLREDIVVNHVHPGYVDTDMTSHKGPLTVEQGSVAALYLALLPPNITSPRGSFIWHDKQEVDWINGPLPAAY